jgi:membrane protein DedA with SNARE-associated domain
VSAPPALPGIFHTLAPVLNHYGYLAVGGFLFLEDFGVPVPGETILIAASVYAGAGRLNIALVVVIAFVAAVLGDNLGFLIGHFGGRPLVERWGKYVFLTPERLDSAEDWFSRHGGKIVTISRFVEGLRQANGIVAGITGMHWAKFISFNALGAALWVAVWSTLGYVSGSHINAIYGPASKVILYVAAAAILILIFRAVHRRRRRHSAYAGHTADPDRATDPTDFPD